MEKKRVLESNRALLFGLHWTSSPFNIISIRSSPVQSGFDCSFGYAEQFRYFRALVMGFKDQHLPVFGRQFQHVLPNLRDGAKIHKLFSAEGSVCLEVIQPVKDTLVI